MKDKFIKKSPDEPGVDVDMIQAKYGDLGFSALFLGPGRGLSCELHNDTISINFKIETMRGLSSSLRKAADQIDAWSLHLEEKPNVTA